MSFFDEHTINIFTDDAITVKEYIKLSLNLIFFHRWLNNNNYSEEVSNINDISYEKINDESVQNEINNALNKFDEYSKMYNEIQITLKFYTKTTTTLFLFSKSEGLWEKWNILVKISNNCAEESKEEKMRKFICEIIQELNCDKFYMPDLFLEDFECETDVNNDKKNECGFPFEIKVDPNFSQESILNLFKNLNVNNNTNTKIKS